MTHLSNLNNNEEILKAHGMRVTSFRLLVFDILLENKGIAVSSQDIEDALGQHDRITLYRTLKSFEEKGLIHIAVDSDGHSRYALCNHECDSTAHNDSHAHFHCDHCGKTSCLDDMPEKISNLVPSEYVVNSAQITFSGICAGCV